MKQLYTPFIIILLLACYSFHAAAQSKDTLQNPRPDSVFIHYFPHNTYSDYSRKDDREPGYSMFIGSSHFSLSLGTQSGTQMINGLSQGTNDIQYILRSNTGNIFGSYRYQFTKRFSMGITAGYQNTVYNYYYGYASQPYSLQTQTIMTCAIEFRKTYYYCTPHSQLYGFLGLGIASYTQKDDPEANSILQAPTRLYKTRFNSQWTPIGYNIGGRLSFFMELGLGYKGVFNSGLNYFIPSKKKH